jgi:hypothetical protein
MGLRLAGVPRDDVRYGPTAHLAPRPSGEASTREAGQATHGATAGAVPPTQVPLAEAVALLDLAPSRG